jgi:hypothetical protein
MYGQLPPKPAAISNRVERVDATAFGSKATLTEVTIRFGPPEVPPIHLMLVVPNQRSVPVPVILAMNYFGNHDTWINPGGQFEVMRAAAAVYRLLGAGDFADKHFAMSSPRSSGAAADPIIIDPDYPHAFRYQSGGRFFPMGDTAYFLIAQPTNVIAQFIDSRRAHKFNFVRMMAVAEGFWPFGGTSAKPDYTVINETALPKCDWIFVHAASRGMNIELILWGYGDAGGEGLWDDPTKQNLWIDTLVERYRDRPNLFIYTEVGVVGVGPRQSFDAAKDWAK